MSAIKEPWVFAYPDYRDRALGYREMLAAQAPVRGESSAVYSMHPHFPQVPERIAALVPEARFIYLVRDPVERTVSHYIQLVADGKEARPLAEAVADPQAPDNVYVAASRYATQLRRYLEIFDRDRFLVVDQNRLDRSRREVMATVFSFLGIAPGHWSEAFDRRLNTAEEHRMATGLGKRLRAPVSLLRRAPLPDPVRATLRRLSSRRVERPELAPELRAALERELAGEVEWLRDFADQRFADWSM